ncbi:MAG: LysM peptidoglycan-binding domain-containing protein [Caldilineaceae bacterium]
MKTSTRRPLPSFLLSLAQTSRSRILLLVLLVLVSGLLAACTRDRETEEVPTPSPGSALVPAPIAPAPEIDTTTAIGEPLVQTLPVSGTTTTSDTQELRDDGRVIGSYTVESGDTVLSVAIEFGTTAEEIRELNLMTDDLIQVGQVLRVPIIPPTPEPTPEPFYHEVVAGDSLSSIAAQYGVGQIDIITANQLPDPNALRAGMLLIIPGYKLPSAAGEGEEGAAAEPVDPDALAIHVVAPGESLSRIAALYGITVAELMQANGLTDRNNVRTGTELRIPGLTQADALRQRATEHVVAPGESLSEIAQQYNQTVDAIMKMNLITDPNSVRSGQLLYIPPAD